MDSKGKVFGKTVELQLEAENAESNIRRLMVKLRHAHRANAKRQEDCQKAGNSLGYQQAVAEEAAMNAAYQRLNDGLGRMHHGTSESR